jgi:signal transduction histidine kinase/CheY-like chemotaxis protein
VFSEPASLDFRALFESAPGLYLVLTPDFSIVAVSNAYLEATMIKRQDILGRGIFEVFPDNPGEPDATGVRNLRASLERVKQFARADTMPVQKYDIRRPESEGGGFEERYWSPLNSPVIGPDGRVEYIIHRVEDVTEFVRLKRAGSEREKMNEALRERSEQMESEVYLRAREVAGANRQLRAANEDLARLYDQIVQLMTQADAEFGRANIPSSPITPEDMLARVGRMIADHRRLDEQFRQAQKMEAVGQLAGGVAHDFNNLLTVIVGYANLIQASLGPENELRGKVAEIQRAAEQAAVLTGQLLAFSRKQPRQQRLLDLNRVVDDMQDILRRLIAEDIDLKFRLDPAGCPISADANHLSQVLMNLVVNARDAMPIGGKLIVATRMAWREFEYSDGDGVRPAGRYAVLSVADTGLGMDSETRSRIFEPFFSTKGVGKGTGLGLSTVYGIVVQHGGWIEVESEPGRGTTFRIYLPAAGAVPVREVASVQTRRNERKATILLVEDQAAVRLFAEEVLAEAGHKVLSAGNGLAALEVAATHNSDIDLLITDVVMPQMNGPELAARLTSAHPGLNVLYVSGYTGSALLDRGLVPDDFILLKKPFLPEALVNKVDELLQKR